MARASLATNTKPSDLQEGLPPDLHCRLALLNELPPPAKLRNPENWRCVLDDVRRIVDDGWAALALSLGWSEADLFGVGPQDDWEFSGLSVWLCGRDLVALDEQGATAVNGGTRAVFVRGSMGHGTHPTVVPVMLWEFGRRQGAIGSYCRYWHGVSRSRSGAPRAA